MKQAALFAFFLLLTSPCAAFIFTVDTTDDLPDSAIDGNCLNALNKCSLRAALMETNATAAADNIVFNIPATDTGCDVNNVCRITVTNVTPQDVLEATQPVSIDGSTQPGNSGVCSNGIAARPTYRVVLQGAGNQPGLRLAAGANNSEIRGLNLRGFLNTIAVIGPNIARIECNFIGVSENGGNSGVTNNENGVLIGCNSNDVSVGGSTVNQGNLISGHAIDGVQIIGDGCPLGQPNNIYVRGNWIGTDKSGTQDLGNGYAGVSVFGATIGFITNVQIGNKFSAPDPGLNGNVISGNNSVGIYMADQISFISAQGNLIGTTATGNAALGNSFDGIFIEDTSCDGNHLPNSVTIGSLSDPNMGNVLSGNLEAGFYAYCLGDISVGGNVIGLGQNQVTPVPNATGIVFEYGNNSTVGTVAAPNLIAHNTKEGVSIYGTNSNGIRVRGNRMRNNGRLGIDLGLDPSGPNGRNENDPGDLDSGPNGNLNTPVLFNRFFPPMAGVVDISYRVDTDFTTPTPQTKRVDFYVADSDGDEGAQHLGFVDITASGSNLSASFPSAGLDENTKFVATLTDLSTNATSEFSLAFPVPDGIFKNGFEN